MRSLHNKLILLEGLLLVETYAVLTIIFWGKQERTLVLFGSGGARLQSVCAHATDSVHGSRTGGGMCVWFIVDQVHDEGVLR